MVPTRSACAHSRIRALRCPVYFMFLMSRCRPRFKCALTFLVSFFFSSRRRHTRFKCDWSSDVCSSDLDQRRLAGQVIAVRAAGNHLASEAPLIPWFESAGQVIQQPLVAGTFGAQTIEETEHMKIGEYVVLRYGQTSEVQALARWACHMVNTLTMRFLDRFAKSLELSEAHLLAPVLKSRAAAPEATANGHSIGPVTVEIGRASCRERV